MEIRPVMHHHGAPGFEAVLRRDYDVEMLLEARLKRFEQERIVVGDQTTALSFIFGLVRR